MRRLRVIRMTPRGEVGGRVFLNRSRRQTQHKSALDPRESLGLNWPIRGRTQTEGGEEKRESGKKKKKSMVGKKIKDKCFFFCLKPLSFDQSYLKRTVNFNLGFSSYTQIQQSFYTADNITDRREENQGRCSDSIDSLITEALYGPQK